MLQLQRLNTNKLLGPIVMMKHVLKMGWCNLFEANNPTSVWKDW